MHLIVFQAMGGSILLPNWSAYSGTPSQMVALKVVNMVNIVNMVKMVNMVNITSGATVRPQRESGE